MWMAGKADECLHKCQQVFANLFRECQTRSPGAQLSYSLRNRLERFCPEERKDIACRKYDGTAPLFIACQRGNVEIVEYLISVCGADIEQKGLFESNDDQSFHHVTPLWCAAVTGKLAVVKILIKHGADINNVSDTGSTPVRSACFMTNLDIVTYLVQNGADISKPNYNGGTCLINSVQCVALCRYLIEQGADVNEQDIQKKTALHYAIQEHRYETTKLLLEKNANPFLKNGYNDDALQTAGLKGSVSIIKCLSEMANFPLHRIAEAYELLGSTFLDEHHDILSTLQYWQIALDMRLKNDIQKVLPPPCKAFQYMKEFTTIEELNNIAVDHDLIRMQSLLICQRILGNFHKELINRLMYSGATYGDSLQHQKCINMWLYALQLKIEKDTIILTDTCYTAQALVRLYLDMMEKYNAGQICQPVQFQDIYNTISIITKELGEAKRSLAIQPVHKHHQTSFDTILRILTHLLFVFLQINAQDEEEQLVANVVKEILQIDPRTCQGGCSLLHLAVMKSNVLFCGSLLNEYNPTPFPSHDVVKFLLKCGADVNITTTDKGCSSLYLAAQMKNYRHEIVETLINTGAHIDQMNQNGVTAASVLTENPDWNTSIFSKVTLKCLAAAVIRRNGICYRGEIPLHLESFVEMH